MVTGFNQLILDTWNKCSLATYLPWREQPTIDIQRSPRATMGRTDEGVMEVDE